MATTLAKTRAFAEKILRGSLMGAPVVSSGNPVYIALFPTDPGLLMTSSTELSVAGYTRMAATLDYRVDPISGLAAVFNPDPVFWAAAVTSWGVVGGLAIYPTAVGGAAMYRGAFDTAQTVAGGNQFAIGAGDLIISEG